MTLFVAPVVEGSTEERCIKIILSRIWNELFSKPAGEEIAILPPHPAPRYSLIKDGDPTLERVLERSYRGIRGRMRSPGEDRGFVLVLIDADEDCPKEIAGRLLARAKAIRSDAEVACVLAKREVENWFKAAAQSLVGVQGMPEDLDLVTDYEIGSGDTWLSRQMQKLDPNRCYRKPADAIEFAQRMDLHQCRTNSPSFDKLCRELEKRLPPPEPTSPEPPARA